MNRTVLLIVSVLALVVGGALLGGVVGWRFAQNSRDAQLVHQVDTGRAQYSQAVDAGASAVAAAQATAAAIGANAFTLDQEISDARNPFLVAAAPVAVRCPAGDRPGAHGAGGLAVADPARSTPATAPASAPLPGDPLRQDLAPPNADRAGAPVDGDGGLQLSLGAVRLWNSALSGQPRSATLAADTCPADDPASQACAVGAGLGLRDAWRNLNTNASLCAQDRSQLAELIELLRQRQAQSEERRKVTR